MLIFVNFVNVIILGLGLASRHSPRSDGQLPWLAVGLDFGALIKNFLSNKFLGFSSQIRTKKIQHVGPTPSEYSVGRPKNINYSKVFLLTPPALLNKIKAG